MKNRVKKVEKALLVVLFSLAGLAAIAQQQGGVSNIRVQTMDHVLIIHYDLSVRADIEVFASFDGGATFSEPLQHLTGEAGKGIEPGTNKMIVWNARNEFGAIDIPNAVIKVVSTNGTGAPTSAAQPARPASADIPLVVLGRRVYQWDREMGQDEFNRFMVNKAYKGRMTPLSRSNVRKMLDTNDITTTAIYNRGRKNQKFGYWMLYPLYPLGIGQSFVSKGNMQIREAVAEFNNGLNRSDVSQLMYNYSFERGKKLNRTANTLMWTGTGMIAGGAALGFLTMPEVINNWNEHFHTDWGIVSIVAMSAGAATISTGISMKATASHLMTGHTDALKKRSNLPGYLLIMAGVGMIGGGTAIMITEPFAWKYNQYGRGYYYRYYDRYREDWHEVRYGHWDNQNSYYGWSEKINNLVGGLSISAGALAIGAGIVLNVTQNRLHSRTTDMHNRRLLKLSDLDFDFNFTGNSARLAIRF